MSLALSKCPFCIGSENIIFDLFKFNIFSTNVLVETLDLVKEVVKNDSTKDLINFMREEIDKARDHELKLFHLLQNSNPSANNAFSAYDPQQQGSSGIYQGQSGLCSSEAPGSGMLQSLYNQWYQ